MQAINIIGEVLFQIKEPESSFKFNRRFRYEGQWGVYTDRAIRIEVRKWEMFIAAYHRTPNLNP